MQETVPHDFAADLDGCCIWCGQERRRCPYGATSGLRARPYDPAVHGQAVASVVVGLVSLLLWPLGPVAFLEGWRATSRGRPVGGGDSALAITGMMLGLITSLLSAGVLVAIVLAAAR